MSKTDATIFHFSHLTIFLPDISIPIPGTTIFPTGIALTSLHPACQHISTALSSSCTVSIIDAVGECSDPLAFFYHFSVPILSVLCTSLCCFVPNGYTWGVLWRASLYWNSVLLMPRNLYHSRVVYSQWVTSAEIWKPSPLAFKQNKLWDGVYAPELLVGSGWGWDLPWKLSLV